MKVAVIPARGGSKRIPGKNIRAFHDKPMIAWSIEVAIRSGLFDRVIVSTDDNDVRKIAIAWGAEVPFERPRSLADDHTGTLPVIRHAISWFISSGIAPQQVCCIYATAPFLQCEFLQRGLDHLEADPEVDFAFSATEFSFPIFRAIRVGASNETSMFWPEHESTRSQDLPKAYHDAGQFYWGTADAWLHKDRIFTENSRAVILPSHLVQDIDTPDDWIQAEQKFRVLRINEND